MPSNPHPRRWLARWLVAMPAVLALGATILLAAPSSADDDVDFWLTVFHNNDGESDLLPSPVIEDDDLVGFEGGVAYFAKVLGNARSAANVKPPGDNTKRASLFVSSGDNFLAGPAFTASVADGVFYDAVALDRLSYDAIDLGNHDFDFGPDVLARFISEGFANPGKPPYLSANLDVSGEPALQALAADGSIAASTVVKKKGEKIGIVGATTDLLPFISSPRNVVVGAVLAAVQAEVTRLTDLGVDKIIVISHLQDINEDLALATLLHDVDVMIAGGGDELLANPGDPLLPSDDPGDIFGDYPLIAVNVAGQDVPMVTTPGQYGYLGQLVVGFDEDGDVVAIDHDRSLPLRVVSDDFASGVKPDGAMNAQVVAPVEAFVAGLAANVIATSQVALDGRRNAVRSVETNQGNLIADAIRWQAGQLAADFAIPVPDVALQNGGGIRNDSILPAGDVTELDTFAMVPFPSFVAVLPAVPRSNFKEVLEHVVAAVNDPPPDPPGGSGRFAQVSGFSFEWDQNEPDGAKVSKVVLDDGTVIVDGTGAVVAGADLSVATIDFLARGGDQYPFSQTDPPSFTTLGVSYQQALASYLQASLADGGLDGLISSGDYPEGGEGRITRHN